MQALHAHGTHIYVGKHSYRIKINKALLRKNLSIEHWLPKEEMDGYQRKRRRREEWRKVIHGHHVSVRWEEEVLVFY